MELYIGRDFSRVASTRYRKDGADSGEAFREEHVVPALHAAISAGHNLTVVIDTSCSGAFLHEVFAKLPQHGFSRLQVSQHLTLTVNQPHMDHYSLLALRHLRQGYDSPKLTETSAATT